MKKVRLLALAGVCVWCAARGGAVTLTEDFSANPLQEGWRLFGDTNLFRWDATNQDLRVTWDSSQSNSYFYHPLGTILTTNDAFSLSFDLTLNDASTGGFEIALGLLNFADATGTNFLRGTGDNVTNLVEFDYFAPDSFGDPPSVDATLVDTNDAFEFLWDNLPLTFGDTYHVSISHAAGSPSVRAQILRNGAPYTTLPNFYGQTNFTDFRLDAVSISSYSDAGAYGSSILAHGVVDNLVVTLPPPPIQNLAGAFTNGVWQARFTGRADWLYTLERSPDLRNWNVAAPPAPGTDGTVILSDTNPPAGRAFYRVRASRP